jgi:hypothetical protein
VPPEELFVIARSGVSPFGLAMRVNVWVFVHILYRTNQLEARGLLEIYQQTSVGNRELDERG